MTSLPPLQPQAGSAEPDLVDFRKIRELIGFVLRSVSRHRWLSALAAVSMFSLAIIGLKIMPRTYRVDTTILTQKNQVMASLGNPNHPSLEGDAPTRAAAETVLKHDNLVALVKQANLLDTWEESRAPILRLKDTLMSLVRGKLTDEERMEALVGLLGRKLRVYTGEGTITIQTEWHEASSAYRLVESAQQNFLEARHAAEISTIAEAISILEGHAANVHEAIEAALDEVHKYEGRRQGSTSAPRRRAAGISAAEKELAQLRVMLAAKQRAISDLEEFRRRRLGELQGQLAEQKAMYTPAHPMIANTEQSIASLSRDSPQIIALKREAEEISREYLARGGKDPGATPEAPPPPPREEIEAIRREPPRTAEDDSLEYARSRLRIASRKYEDLLDRIDAARIALDTARAAFKYRYSVVRPPQMPKKADKPVPALFIGGGIFMGIAMAFVLSTLKDVMAGKIVERWQVERSLEIPVLTEVGPV
jgi:uncharacterized protein involved in exopolysaccharide biosynthesis